jgi:hypothetical protein
MGLLGWSQERFQQEAVSPVAHCQCPHACPPPAVALEFRRNTNGKIGRQDFLWTVKHVMGIDLAPQLVGSALCVVHRLPPAAPACSRAQAPV